MRLNNFQRQWICLFGLLVAINSLFFIHFWFGFISVFFGVFAIFSIHRLIGWSTIGLGILGIVLSIF